MDDYLLIVDDNDACRDIGRILFEDLLRVETARNGIEAVDCISTQIPGVILLDLNMPLMSGYEVLDFLQTDPVLASIPVIIWSASYDTDYERWPTQVVRVLKKGRIEIDTLQELCMSQITGRLH